MTSKIMLIAITISLIAGCACKSDPEVLAKYTISHEEVLTEINNQPYSYQSDYKSRVLQDINKIIEQLESGKIEGLCEDDKKEIILDLKELKLKMYQ